MPFAPRAHQAAAVELAAAYVREWHGPAWQKVVTAEVTPGGGKTILGALWARALLAPSGPSLRPKVERVAWIVPRTSLVDQVAEGFEVPAAGLYGRLAPVGTRGRVIDQRRHPGALGYVATYHAVACNTEAHVREFDRVPTLLVLDEPHHMADPPWPENERRRYEMAPAWTSAVAPLVERAEAVLCLSGTLYRHDGWRVPFVRYKEGPMGAQAASDIVYSRADALRDGAVRPMVVRFVDGWARFSIAGGPARRVDISAADVSEQRRVIRAFLSAPEYRMALVRQALEHWRAQRSSTGYGRALVVCHRQDVAAELAATIPSIVPGARAVVATTNETDAHGAIRRFRSDGEGDVLVTVGMAYEGLDIPDLTHLACLTDYRSAPWIEQAFARVTRQDSRAPEGQRAHVWAPDDPLMRQIVKGIMQPADKFVLGGDEAWGGSVERAEATERPSGEGARSEISLGAGAGSVRTFDELDGWSPELEAQVREAVPAARQLTSGELRAVAATALSKLKAAG